ncbi:MAG: DUF6325 family protein [Candidatus Dormibacteraeota bacterium]|nr:DUF6325 family protein [Candidatus Dormibacteraeota bacterium]
MTADAAARYVEHIQQQSRGWLREFGGRFMILGPVEVAVIEFEGSHFKGEIASGIREAVDRGIVRIIDLVFIAKDEAGSVRSIELDDMETDVAEAMSPITDEVMGLVAETDVSEVGDRLPNNCSAAIIAFEHVWLRRLREAILNANGQVVSQVRIPADIVERALAAKEAGDAGVA